MSALTSLLARDQVVPVRKIEEALSRQVLEGGEIETVLLEMGLVQEDVLSAYRAALYGLLPATREEVMRASRQATRVLPAPIAQQLRLLPISYDGKSLVVAAAEPPSESAQRKVSEVARAKISVRIVNEPRLLAGLSHHYGLELEHRFSRLIDKLRRKGPGTITYVKPPAGGPIRRPASEPPDSSSVQVEPARSLRPGPATSADAQGMPDNVTFAVAKACRGPLVEQRAQEVLAQCETREDVLYVVLRYASQFFEFSAIFSVQGGSARGRASRGAGVAGEVIRSIDVPLSGNGLMARAVRDKRPLVGLLSQVDDERVATAPLGRPPGRPGIAAPITLGTRVVLVLYVDRDGEALGPDDAAPLSKLWAPVGEALRRIIVSQKALSGARSSLLPGMPSLAPESELVHEEVEIRGAPEPPAVQPSYADELPDEEDDEASDEEDDEASEEDDEASEENGEGEDDHVGAQNARDEPPLSELSGGAERFPARVETRRMGALPAGPRARDATNGSGRPRGTQPMDEIQERPPAEAAQPPGAEGSSLGEPPPGWVPPIGGATLGAGGTLRGVPRAAPPPPASDSAPPGPASEAAPAETEAELPRVDDPGADPSKMAGTYSLHSEQGLRSERAGPRSSRPPAAYGSPAIPRFSAPARASRVRGEVRAEPSIVVETGTNVSNLIAALMQCSPDENPPEIFKLVEAGEAALPELVHAFPGPLWFDRHQPHRRRPAARDISAVARVILAFGPQASPYVAALVREGSGDVVYYALMLAGEIPSGELVEPVARRMFDPDPGIAQLSIEVLQVFVHLPEFSLVLNALSQLAGEKQRPLRQQFALRALAQLGDARAVPTLVTGMGSAAPAVARVAHEALVLLTCQDFGPDPNHWQGWLSDWSDAHRVEWLIESLLHQDERLRSLAGQELTRVTHQSFGYHPGLAPREREVAQRKYREWWEREGRASFSR